MDCEKTFFPCALWERKVRARDFASMLANLSSKATKLASFVTSAEAANLGDTLLNTATRIEEQRSLFDRLHCTPEKFVMELMDGRDTKMFKGLPLELECKIMVSVAFSLISSKEFARAHSVLGLRIAKKSGMGHLCLSLLDFTKPQVASAALHVQNTIFATWMDRIVRKAPPDFFESCMSCLRSLGVLPPVDWRQKAGIKELDLAIVEHGWTPQNGLDLLLLEFLAQVTAQKDGAKLRLDARAKAEKFIPLKSLFSNRLLTYIRVAGIGSTNNAKLGWDKMERQCDAGGASAERLGEVSVNMRAFL